MDENKKLKSNTNALPKFEGKNIQDNEGYNNFKYRQSKILNQYNNPFYLMGFSEWVEDVYNPTIKENHIDKNSQEKND